jgi:hypothetical protein
MPFKQPYSVAYLDSLTPKEIRTVLGYASNTHAARALSRLYLVERILREELHKQLGYATLKYAAPAFGLHPKDVLKSSRQTYQRLLAIGFTPQEILNLETHIGGPNRGIKDLTIKLHETSDKVEIKAWIRSKTTPEDREELLATQLLMQNDQNFTKTTWSSLTKEWHTEQKTVASTFEVLRRKYGITKDGHALSLLAAVYVVVRDYPYGRRRGKLAALAEEYNIDASVIDRDLFSTEIPQADEKIPITIEAEDTTPLSIHCTPSEMRFLRHCFRRLARSQGRFIGVTTNYHDLLLSIFVEWQERLDTEELGT